MYSIVDDLFNSGFEQEAILTNAQGSKSIKVIYDSKYEVAKSMGVDIESSCPQVLCKSNDVSAAKHGDTVSIAEGTFYISEIQNQGDGTTTLILRYD